MLYLILKAALSGVLVLGITRHGPRNDRLSLRAGDLDRWPDRHFMNKDKAMRPAFLTAALIALTGCASTPPMTDPEQRPSEEITVADCGKQPVRTRMSSMPPRLVIYRACKAQVRSGGKASEATKE